MGLKIIKMLTRTAHTKQERFTAEQKKRKIITPSKSISPQKFHNGEIHNWYRITLGYSDHLVAQLLEKFEIQPEEMVIDPFCGTGTTLVECMKRGIDSLGIDANPSSYFSAKVKTNWRLKNNRLRELLSEIEDNRRKYIRRKKAYYEDRTYQYLEKSGMLARGWFCPEPLRQAIAIKACIADLRTTSVYKNALMLSLVDNVQDIVDKNITHDIVDSQL